MATAENLLEIKNLKKYFPIKCGVFRRTIGHIKAVDGLNFTIKKGETLALVGESGCGKSTTGRVILRLLEATEGEVIFEGSNIFELRREDMRIQRRKMQIILQDPYSSLDPKMTVGNIISEALEIHNLAFGKEKWRKVGRLLEKVGLSSQHIRRYPYEFSGGQRQRINLARTLAVEPKFIICDEPVSALDVSIQAQIINLMEDLQDEFNLSYLFISHDLGVVKHISNRVAVMYVGKIVELANKKDLFKNPLHPYTRALLSAIPIPDPDFKRKQIILKGDVASPKDPPAGCRFHTRCPDRKDICSVKEPDFKPLKGEHGEHYVACHLY